MSSVSRSTPLFPITWVAQLRIFPLLLQQLSPLGVYSYRVLYPVVIVRLLGGGPGPFTGGGPGPRTRGCGPEPSSPCVPGSWILGNRQS